MTEAEDTAQNEEQDTAHDVAFGEQGDSHVFDHASTVAVVASESHVGTDRKRHRRSSTLETELKAALQLSLEILADVNSAADVQQVRADLTVIRERLDASGTELGRAGRQSVWEQWQHVNQTAWQTLSDRWELKAQSLVPLLDQAEDNIRKGQPREAREGIKQFRAAVASNEISHQRLRELSLRAESLWKQASELSREKHKKYLEHSARRVESWRGALERQRRVRASLAQDVEHAQQQSREATTDVGAALLRGQTVERQRQLETIDAEIRDLEGRIRVAEEQKRREPSV